VEKRKNPDQVTRLLSGNEAMALGAYHAGVKVATAYPGTPSTEILENIARFQNVYAEWSTNEKVALEVAMGASYTGARALTGMKHVGLNVAADPLMSASITGVKGGFVIVSADDPGMHSSQNEQDSRHYARLAKIPCLEPYDSQSAYNFMIKAFEISEMFDTPVLFRSTTRISHSKSVVLIYSDALNGSTQPGFIRQPEKYVMLPVFARARHPVIEKRIDKIKEYALDCSFNEVIPGNTKTGVISSSIAFQYAREVFLDASFLRLGMTYPLSENLIRKFASGVEKLIVIEELDPFLEEMIRSMGVEVTGKAFIPVTGELAPGVVARLARDHGLEVRYEKEQGELHEVELPARPPSMCPGCPHRGIFFVLARLSKRRKMLTANEKNTTNEPGVIITGDIGCYTLGAYPPLSAMDTCACMGAGIGQALGMEKAGLEDSLIAVIGDSTFMHSGMTSLADAIYNQSKITIIILDNMTTGMTGHQGHPGTGVSASGRQATQVKIEDVVRSMGVNRVEVLDAFDMENLRRAIKSAIDCEELSVLIVRGDCAPVRPRSHASRVVLAESCTRCHNCLKLACSAIHDDDGRVIINSDFCAGDNCGVCEQVCPSGAINIKGRTV